MSTSEARIIANRANALKSTGPKTEAGKLQSRRNSLQHGLRSEGVVLLPADEAKLLERRESWGRVLRPVDEVEGFLVEQAILHSVKFDRLTMVESALACASVELADREYEAHFLARIERVEAEVRDWERLEGLLQQRGTLGRDGLEVIVRLLGIEGPEDPRRSDLVALSRAASAELGGSDESGQKKARETLGDLIGARLDERRRALGRLFEELEDPRGRALARAAAALDVGPVGQLTHRYQKSEELGLTRMLDQLDRRRRSGSKGDVADRGQNSQRASEPTSESLQIPQTAKPSEQSSGLDKLGKLPNEPNGIGYAEGSDGSGDLGKLPNEPNGLGMAERSDGSGSLGKLPNEPNGLGTVEGSDGSGSLGKLPNEPNAPRTEARSEGSGELGKLPNEPNGDLIADRAGELGGMEGFPISGLPSVAGA